MLGSRYVSQVFNHVIILNNSSRILDEIDDYLLRELDTVVRAGQLACLPFVRSGRAEGILHTKYPQLADMIKQEKQQLIDDSISSSRAGHINHSIIRASASDKRNSEANSRKASDSKGVDSREGRAISILSNEISNAETIFSMDDFATNLSKTEEPGSYQHDIGDGSNASGKVSSATNIVNYGKGRLIWPPADMQGSKLSDNDQRISKRFLESTSGESLQSQARGSPWGSILSESKGTVMKDIMAEDSTKYTSSTSIDALSRNSVEGRAQGSFTKKVSQKSRKKLQAEQHSQSHVSKEAKSPFEISKSKENPWQGSTKAINIQGKSDIATQASNSSKAPSNIERAISGSQLTMRQTVAHSNPASEGIYGSPAHISEPLRAVSSPATPKRDSTALQIASPPASTLSPSPQASRSVPKPQIQSIRHTPMPARTASDFDANYAISDILSQQQAEKESIRDAAAKRSLQEIQTEQEFQEWWDQESKKVMEEQQAMVSGPSRRQQRDKGRGRGIRRKYDKKDGREKGGSSGRGGEGGAGGKNSNSKRGAGGSSRKASDSSTVVAAATSVTTATSVVNTEGRKSEQKSPHTRQRRHEKELEK